MQYSLAGASKELVSALLAGSGILEAVMKISNGWLADRKLMTAYSQMSLCMLITGVAALFCAAISGTAGKRGQSTIISSVRTNK